MFVCRYELPYHFSLFLYSSITNYTQFTTLPPPHCCDTILILPSICLLTDIKRHDILRRKRHRVNFINEFKSSLTVSQ